VGALPTAGRSGFALTLDTTATAAALLVGPGNGTWAGFGLPLDLGPFGAPGCALGVAIDVAVSAAGPDPSVTFALPNQPMDVFVQWMVLDPVNALGIALSESRRIEIR
jgi:hypothetical protein